MDVSNGDGVVERFLFGGALSCVMPITCDDVSAFREVPDHQEVFCHRSTDQSMMVDILEYLDACGEEAPRLHFMDIAEANQAVSECEIMNVEKLSKDQILLRQCDEAWFLTGRQMVSKFAEQSDAKNLIDIHLALLRLPRYGTDIVVIMNDPVTVSSKSSSSGVATRICPEAWTIDTFKQAVCTLQLLDATLLGAT